MCCGRKVRKPTGKSKFIKKEEEKNELERPAIKNPPNPRPK